jgi:hypothetical protein
MHRVKALEAAPPGLRALERWTAALAERPGWRAHVETALAELRVPDAAWPHAGEPDLVMGA